MQEVGDVRSAIELLQEARGLTSRPGFSDLDRADILFRLAVCRFKLSHELFQGLWAIVHGLTSLEVRGVLGTPEECDRVWRETITTHVRGLATSN